MENIKKHLEYKNDFLLFANNEAVMLTPFGVKKVKLFNFQSSLLENIKDTNFDIIVSSRQMGVTNLLALYIAWVAIFDENKNIAIMSNKQVLANHILKLVIEILKNYSIKECFDLEKELNGVQLKSKFSLKNLNVVRAVTSSPHSFIGMQTDILIIDNAAFIKNLKNILVSTSQIFALKGSKLILASTPSRNSHFNKMVLYHEDNDEINNDKSISLNKLPWKLHPNRNEEWYEKQRLMLQFREDLIDEEYNCVVKTDEYEQKNKTISLRLQNKLLFDIKTKIGDELSISDYIRGLVEKDLRI